MKITTKKIRTTAILISLIFAMGFNALAIWQYVVYTETEKEWVAEKERMATLKRDIVDTKRQIEQFEIEKEEFAKLLLDERDIPAFLDEISKYARENDINIINMRTKRFYQVKVPVGVTKKTVVRGQQQEKTDAQRRKEERERIITISALPIEIKVKGEYAALVEFLNNLGDYKQLVIVNDVEIKSTREYPTLQCSFILKIYSLKTLDELKRS